MAEQFEKDRKIFLESFPGVKCYQTFDDVAERKSKKLIWQRSSDGNKYPIDGEIDFTEKIIPMEIIQGLEARNEYRACCSLTINETNGKGRKTEDVIKVRAVWADFDGAPLPSKFEEEPSIMIETSPGKYHAYWFTVQEDKYSVPLESFTSIQKGIAKKFDSDKYVKDLPKAMRMPGFYHCKGKKFLSRVISYTGNTFEFGLLVAMFPPLPRETWSSEKYKTTDNNSSSEYKGNYGAGKGGRNHHIVKRVGGMLKRGLKWADIEIEAYKEAQSCLPPLPPYEVKAILKSMMRYK